jgi:hypothetical protein
MDEISSYPMPILTHQEELNAPKMNAKKLPRYFVHCTKFGLGEFAKKIRREGGTVFELDTGHDAKIIEPEKLSSMLDRIASSWTLDRFFVRWRVMGKIYSGVRQKRLDLFVACKNDAG